MPPGPDIYVDGTRKPLCRRCATAHAPVLLHLQELSLLADAHAFTIRDGESGEDPVEILADLAQAARAFSDALHKEKGTPSREASSATRSVLPTTPMFSNVLQ